MATCSASSWDWLSVTEKDDIDALSLCGVSTPLDLGVEEATASEEVCCGLLGHELHGNSLESILTMLPIVQGKNDMMLRADV